MLASAVKARILLVDDHAIVRAGFRYILESECEYDIKEVNTAEEACSVYSDFKPDAVIPITSNAPKLVDINANPATQAGNERPASRNELASFIYFLSAQPIPSTKIKYTSIMA